MISSTCVALCTNGLNLYLFYKAKRVIDEHMPNNVTTETLPVLYRVLILDLNSKRQSLNPSSGKFSILYIATDQ